MLIRIKPELMSCTHIDGSKYDVTLLKSQALDLIELLKLAVADDDTIMRKYRTKFFDEEGYMGSDAAIKNKYGIS